MPKNWISNTIFISGFQDIRELFNFMSTLRDIPRDENGMIKFEDYTIDLDSLADKEIQGHNLKIKHLAQGDSAQECQLLFITEEEKPIRVREWLKNIANKPVLTVSGTDEFLDNGGMIGLVNDGNHLQFEVNLKRVEQVGIKLSSKMLQIARAVRVKQ